jgi:two-component system sensor histidine kinase TctE
MSAAGGGRIAAHQPEKATLHHQLLISLLAPIVLVTLISAVVSYYYAFNFATLAYDYSLFDSALDISRQTRIAEGKLRVDLPRAALDMLESDKHDRIYYMVSDARGMFVAGHRGLPLPPGNAAPGKPVYYDGSYRGGSVRIAALYSLVAGAPDENPILIQVAETLNKRHILANELLLGMLLPELLLIVLVGALVWYGVARGLRPLAVLQKEISNRSHRDLSPLPEQNAPGEVRSLIRAMNELLARLSEALSAQQRFIADAAHQLRTPLAGLKTQTELALRQKELDEVRHTLQHLNTATGQTTHLVNQLLSLARAEPGANRTQAQQPINLGDLARETTTEWVPRAIERNIDLGFDASAGAATIEGDTLLIKEMLGNLLDNAIRYTQRGGQVTVRVAAARNQVVLSIEDNGPGIPPAERERVFERFHRVLGSSAEGCGLGLAIVREIAQSYNADVRLGPGAGGSGTLVTVAFSPAA